MSRQQMPAATRGRSEHDFRQSHAEWETSVFDNAAIFTAVTWHPTHLGDRIRHEFPTFAAAVAWVNTAPPLPAGRGWCIYAVTPSGRSIVLDRAAWPAWLARAMTPLQPPSTSHQTPDAKRPLRQWERR